MTYHMVIEKPAARFISSLPKNDKERILRAISKLPNEGDIKPLRGHKGFNRLRVGSYRIIYTVDHGILTVRIVDAGNRGQIYNRY